jgi:hypothetical protein
VESPQTLLVGVRDAETGTTIPRQFRPFLSAKVSPLRWDTAAKCYATTVVVGLDSLPGDEAADGLQFPQPIRFDLTGDNVDRLEPPSLEVSRAGVGGYQQFTVFTKQFEHPVRVGARSRFGDDHYEANVDPGTGLIKLGQSASQVDGFGLGKATISVGRYADNGQLLPVRADSRVQLQTSAGHLEPEHVDLKANTATGEAALFSESWGVATVRPTNMADAHEVVVDFAFPTFKFLLGFAGAACAGVLRVLTVKRQKRLHWAAVFLGCVVSGLTVDILASLGAPVAPGWLLSIVRNALAWFAVGVLAGYPGVSLIASLGERWFESKPQDEPASTSA